VRADSKLYLCAGEETYDAVQQVLEKMDITGSLKKTVDVPLSVGSHVVIWNTMHVLGIWSDFTV
jgi:hypothetical protein